jgi:Flp pilus assembly protein TadD
MVYLDNGNIEESARLSELALAGGARPVEALVVAASLALGRIDADAAIRICNEVLADNPGEGRSWSGLGLASMLKRDLPAAERQLEQAVKFMPGHPGTLHALGWCKILSSDLRGARAIFLKALELDRNFGDSHGGLAVVQALDGERQAAEESIKRALGLDPNSLSAKFARMALDGKVSDPARFRALVPRLLAGYRAPFGQSLDAMLDEYEER